MTRQTFRPKKSARAFAVILVLIGLSCGGKNQSSDSRLGGRAADTMLVERGKAALEDKDWTEARNYFQQLLDSYPRSQLAGDARLGVADSYFFQRGAGNLVLSIAEYRDFLTFFPNHPRADYAQYQIALAYYNQIHSSDRDQEPTRTAVEEFEKLVELYRHSLYAEEGKTRIQECYERLAEHEFQVGYFYLKTRKWCRGAIPRLKGVLEEFPTFSGADKVYYHLAQAHELCNRPSEAMPYYKQLIENYPESELKEKAAERLGELLEKAGEPQIGQAARQSTLK